MPDYPAATAVIRTFFLSLAEDDPERCIDLLSQALAASEHIHEEWVGSTHAVLRKLTRHPSWSDVREAAQMLRDAHARDRDLRTKHLPRFPR